MGRDKPWYHPYSEKISALFSVMKCTGTPCLIKAFAGHSDAEIHSRPFGGALSRWLPLSLHTVTVTTYTSSPCIFM